MIDTMTIIRARRGRRLAKIIENDGKMTDYDAAYRYDLIPQAVADLDAVHALLARLLDRSDCAIVRGVPLDPGRCANVRRLAFGDPATGDMATLEEAPHSWVALDLDGVERPAAVPAADLIGCAEAAGERLPTPFHGARCIVQASASHGLKPGCRLRLWYWLSRPTSGGELKRWLQGFPADPAVFRTVQPIYTAAPIFSDGRSDHLPRRIVDLPGMSAVNVPSVAALSPPPPRAAMPLPKPNAPGAGRYAFAALANAATRVQQAGIGQRHETLLREARGLGRFVSAGLLSQSDVETALCGAGENAGKPKDEIQSVIKWAISHPSAAPLPAGVTG